jgi:serine/threonine-protein kinase
MDATGPATPTAAPLPQPRPEDLAGATAGSYRLVRMLGRGGLSSVWLGEHPVIGSRVAIKVLHPQVSACEEAARRFVVEAQAANRIQSPHVVRVFDFCKLAGDGRDCAVMELLDGETLGDLLARRGRLSWRELRPLALQIARALVAAHGAGIIHRDLKPDNIFLVADGERTLVKLLDFGIAKLLDGREEPLHRGGAVGTPLYAAPEQAAGDEPGPETDIYSLGVVLFEALAGQPPFCGSAAEVLSAKLTEQPPPLASAAPAVPAQVARLVDAMLATARAARPASVALVLDQLEQGVLEELACASPPAGAIELGPSLAPACVADDDRVYLPAEATGHGGRLADSATSTPLPSWPRRHRWTLRGLALGLLALATAVALAAVLQSRSPSPSPAPPPPTAARSVPPPPRTPASTPAAREEPAPSPRPAASRQAPRPPSRTVVLDSDPPTATVRLGRRVLGTTPLRLRIDRRLTSLALSVEKPGYRARRVALGPEHGGSVRVELSPAEWVDPFRQ